MNKAVFKEEKLSGVDFPAINAFASVNCSFLPELERVGPKDLKAIVKVTLHLLEDMTGSKRYDIFSCTCRYDLPVTENVTIDDFYLIYLDAQHRLARAWAFFQTKNNMRPIPLHPITKEALNSELLQLFDWYNGPLN